MKKILDNKYTEIAFAVCGVIVFYFIILHLGDIFSAIGKFMGILTPLTMGLVIAYIMHPIVDVLENKTFKNIKNKSTRRNVSIAVTLLAITIILGALISIVIPELLKSIQSLLINFPRYLQELESFINDYLSNSSLGDAFSSNSSSIVSTITDAINNIMLPSVNNAMSSVGTGLLSLVKSFFNLLIGIAFAVYILANTKNFAAGCRKFLYSLFDVDKVNDFIIEVKHVNKIFVNFMICKVTDSSIVALSTFIFLLIFGFPYPLLVAVIIGMTDLIPYFGPYIGTIPSALLICLVSPFRALVFVAFIICLQQIDANLITPRIQSNATGLPSFWVLFAITVFGGLFGIVGLLIGVPCFTIIYELVRDKINSNLENKNMPSETDYYEKHDILEKKIIKAKMAIKK